MNEPLHIADPARGLNLQLSLPLRHFTAVMIRVSIMVAAGIIPKEGCPKGMI